MGITEYSAADRKLIAALEGVREQMRTQAEALLATPAADYGAYRHATGVHAGLQMALQIMEEAKGKRE